MDQGPLDKEMDAVIERLAGKGGISGNAYGTDPLASDHLLLRQSWGFFKRRVASIEQQWREISDAKSEEIEILKKQLAAVQERLHDLESDKLASADFLRALELARLEDHESFKKERERMNQRWEEERIALEGDRLRLEQTVKQKDERIKYEQEALAKMRKDFDSLRAAAREEQSKTAESQAQLAKQLNENLIEKDNLFQSEQLKTELLRRELERRDQLLAESALREKDFAARVRMLEKELAEVHKTREEREIEVKREREDISRMVAERARLLEDWQREKAEWRELWDRKQSSSDFENRRQGENK